MKDLPPLPDDVQALLRAAELGAPPPPPGVEAAVLAKVTATVAAPITAVAAAPTLIAAKPVAAFLLGTTFVAAVAVGWVAVRSSPRQEPISTAVAPAIGGTSPPESFPAALPVPSPAPFLPPAPPLTAEPAAAVVQDAPPSRPAMTAETDAVQEAALLETARDAIARGDGDVALRKLQEHARVFPRGKLTEERRALTVVAFSLRREDERADAAAKAFEHDHPTSLFLELVRAAVASSHDDR